MELNGIFVEVTIQFSIWGNIVVEFYQTFVAL